MPSASNELQKIIIDRFGSLDDNKPIAYLSDRGYKLLPGFIWQPKVGVTTYADMEQDEYDCLLFLVHEWDFGGLTTYEGDKS